MLSCFNASRPQLACIHEDQSSKTFDEIEEEKEQHKIQLERNPDQAFHPNPDMRLGRNPAQEAPAQDASALDHAEAVVIALSWARERFIAPPKYAKYVTAGMLAYCAVLAASGVYQLGMHLISNPSAA